MPFWYNWCNNPGNNIFCVEEVYVEYYVYSVYKQCRVRIFAVYFSIFPVYFKCTSRVFPVYFRCTTDVKSMYTSVFTTCNIEIYMVTIIYITCVCSNDALLASCLAGVRARFEPTNCCVVVGHPTD